MRALLVVCLFACATPAPKVLDIGVAPSATTSAASAPPLAQRAEDCFAAPACPMAQAEHDFLAADDAGQPVDCFRFYYGTGVTKDDVRARRCFTRVTRKETCDASPDLARLVLATMLVDGQGGPTDARAAQDLLHACTADVSVSGVLTAERAGKPIDFCIDIGGTTLSMIECNGRAHDRAVFALQRWQRSIEPRMNESTRKLFGDATRAFEAFSKADAEREADTFRGGSLANVTYSNHVNALLLERVARLERPKAGPTDVPALSRQVEKRNREIRDSLDAQGRVTFDRARAAWSDYTQKESAFAKALGVEIEAAIVRDRLASLAPVD